MGWEVADGIDAEAFQPRVQTGSGAERSLCPEMAGDRRMREYLEGPLAEALEMSERIEKEGYETLFSPSRQD